MTHTHRSIHTLIAALCLGFCTLISHAAGRPGGPVRPFVAMGFTGGGDEVASFNYSNSTTTAVHAGGLVHFMGGVDMALGGAMSVQLNLGYHFDAANASNGSYTFSRMPLEALAHIALSDNFRLGGGLRWALDPRISTSGVLSGNNARFSTRTGLVLEGEYFPISRLGLKLRLVHEDYSGEGINQGITYDGSHVGLYAAYYFN